MSIYNFIIVFIFQIVMSRVGALLFVVLLVQCVQVLHALLGLETDAHKTYISSVSESVIDFLKCNLCETVELQGRIEDCSCEYTVVNDAVLDYFQPLLKELTSSTYFKYFRVNLESECPYWYAENQCMMEKCSVCTCDEDEVPETWLDDVRSKARQSRLDTLGGVRSVEDGIFANDCADDTDVSAESSAKPLSGQWVEPPDWEGSSTGGEHCSVFVNLLENPERHTGYAGEAATRVWDAVMSDNCFLTLTDGSGNEIPLQGRRERRMFYKLISGLRASISTHIAREYYYGPGYSGPPPLTNTGDIPADEEGEWGMNLPLFVERVGQHPDRVENMYFSFLFVLRATSKLERLIHQGKLVIDTGDAMSDARVREQLLQLAASSKQEMAAIDRLDVGVDSDKNESLLVTKAALCRDGFSEQGLFSCSDVEQQTRLLTEFRAKFLNISRVMNCVTCEKCKLWGKLQTMGLGTAVKLLLPSTASDIDSDSISRQELVALINLLNQLSKSVVFAADALPAELNHKLGGFAGALGYFKSSASQAANSDRFPESTNQTISSGDVMNPFVRLLKDFVLGSSKRRPASPAIIRNSLQGILLLAFAYVLYQRVRQKLSLDTRKEYEPKL